MLRFLLEDFGNEGSRTHEFGARARQAVQQARDHVGRVVDCQRDEVIFTSGATEGNNLAILGLFEFGVQKSRKHIISTSIEHKAVLEPLEELQRRGFDVEFLPPNTGGWVDSAKIESSIRPDTLLVSVMHANNETGVIQPIEEIATLLEDHPAYFHVDAAQTFGKLIGPLRNKRIDLISASAHKIFGPKGVGALITRRRGYERPPLKPLIFGGGQEKGLRPGTLPVHLIAGLGEACVLALRDENERAQRVNEFRKGLLQALTQLSPTFHGDQSRVMPNVLNVSIPGLNSEAAIVALKDLIAISNGSACTSSSYSQSHVLQAMRLSEEEILSALRFSWCHLTPQADWAAVVARIKNFM